MKKLFLLLPAIVLLITACSKSDKEDTDEGGGATSESVKDVISELEKKGDYSTFAQALKSLDLGNYEGPLTIFAVHDKASDIENLTAGKISMYTVKGSFDEKSLESSANLTAINGNTIPIETEDVEFEDNTKKITYIDGNVLEGTPITIGSHLVYTMHRSLATTPPSSDTETYNEWLGKRMQGTWVVSKNVELVYNYYYDSGMIVDRVAYSDDKTSFIDKTILKEDVNSCYITISYNKVNDENFGNIKINHKVFRNDAECNNTSGVYGTLSDAASTWYIRKKAKEESILSYQSSHSLILKYPHPVTSITALPLNQKVGVGKNMQIIKCTSEEIGGWASSWLKSYYLETTIRKISDKPLFTPKEIKDHLFYLH